MKLVDQAWNALAAAFIAGTRGEELVRHWVNYDNERANRHQRCLRTMNVKEAGVASAPRQYDAELDQEICEAVDNFFLEKS